MARSILLLCGVIVFLALPTVNAQDYLLDELYGRGVHAYFAGRYFRCRANVK